MKNELRKYYKDVRNKIEDKDIKDNKIQDKLMNNKYINDCKLILVYVSFNNEVDTINLIKYFLKDKLIAVPRIDNDMMNFYYIKSLSELKNGKYNILEPVTNNMVNDFTSCVSITPGVCFSRDLYRIGYGKGFYDKFYSEHREIYKIGLTYDECIIDNFNIDLYDQKLDLVITQNNMYKNDI